MRMRSSLAALAVAAATSAQSPLHTSNGEARGVNLGASVAALGDVDADGHDDFAFGAPGSDAVGVDSGQVIVRSGATGAVLLTLNGVGPGDRFGFSVASAGDHDGDGRCDVIVGAIGRSANGQNSGAAVVHSGANGSVLRTYYGSGAFEVFGWAVAGVGDVNGDGFDDVAVGAPGDDANGANAGRVDVLSGASGTVLHRLRAGASGDQFGRAVAGAGDVDADGCPDVVVGAPFSDLGAVNGGCARVFSGRNGGLICAEPGDSAEEYWAWSVGGCGDLDSDGHAEWIVGSPFDELAGQPRGSAWVFSGRTRRVLGLTFGVSAYDRFGATVIGVGDFDADGTPDYAVGAPGVDTGAVDAGAVFVFSGRTGATLVSLLGSRPGDGYGNALAGGNDVNADGHSELVVGAGLADGVAVDAGYGAVIGKSFPRCDAPRMTRFGAPCLGTHGGLPRVEVDGRPASGSAISLQLRAAPPFALAVLNLDPLPHAFDLAQAGAATCTLHAAGVTGFSGAVGADGRISHSVWIPPGSTLVGLALHAQWVVVDPANALGAITSDAIAIRPGTP